MEEFLTPVSSLAFILRFPGKTNTFSIQPTTCFSAGKAPAGRIRMQLKMSGIKNMVLDDDFFNEHLVFDRLLNIQIQLV